jgi:hypothetical protein
MDATYSNRCRCGHLAMHHGLNGACYECRNCNGFDTYEGGYTGKVERTQIMSFVKRKERKRANPVCICGHDEQSHKYYALEGLAGASGMTCTPCYQRNPERFCAAFRPASTKG